MLLKLLSVFVIAFAIVSCKPSNENTDDFKSKVIGHWYCIVPDSSYEEVIFTDSAFIAHGMAYGTMFRHVKFVYPDSLRLYDAGVLINRSRITFSDSAMTATFKGGQTDYVLISRLAGHERDYELIFKFDKTAQGIFQTEWRSRQASWMSGAKFSRWQISERSHSMKEKNDLLATVDDSFVQATLAADSNYQNSTLPLFHFFDADFDSKEEIGFFGIAGASNEFFKVYKSDGSQFRPWIYEIGRLVHCASFLDTTWIVIYSPVMVGDEGTSDSVITYTIAKNFKDRKSE